MAQQHTLYKLIVLYMLSRIDFSMTFSQISGFVLDREYTSYFTLQSTISELVDSGLIHAQTLQNTTYYTLTSEGQQTVELFGNRLSKPIKDDILQYLKDNKVRMIDEVSVLSDYYRTIGGEYEVRCRVIEKKKALIDLTVSVPTEDQARAVCRQWKTRSQDVYSYVMMSLMQE